MNQKKFYKYRTTMCYSWQTTGKCKYIKNCIFAHGQHELLKPGEYCERIKIGILNEMRIKIGIANDLEKKRKRFRQRNSSTSSTSSLNPNAREFVGNFNRSDRTNSCNSNYSTYSENEYDNDEFIMDGYWKIIHSMIIYEAERIKLEWLC